MDFKAFYASHVRLVWLLILLVPLTILAIGCLALPSLFWDNFVWKYMAGPVVADARDRPVEGITEGYNIVNTAVYGLVVVIFVIGAFELFKRGFVTEFKVDIRLVIGLFPFVVLGGLWRSLEDSGLFSEPAAYFFIAPVIYLTIGLIVALTGFAGLKVYNRSRVSYRVGLALAGVVVACPVVFYSIFYIALPDTLYYFPTPVIPVVIAIFCWASIFLATRKKREVDVPALLGGVGLLLVLHSAYLAIAWPNVNAWRMHYLALSGNSVIITHTSELLLILGMALAFTVAIALVPGAIYQRSKAGKALLEPMNVLVVFAQFLDGAATWRGIEAYGYMEKHIVPAGLISAIGPAAIFILKIVLVLAVIFILETFNERELRKYPNLPAMVRFTVIVLGLAPGVRDMCRLAMGV